MYVLSNDKSFKEMIRRMGKRRLVRLTSQFLFKEHLFISLVHIDYKLVKYLENSFKGFVAPETDDQETLTIEVARFLVKLKRRQLQTIYARFATRKDAMSDLMVYGQKDRCRFIATCWHWELADVERIDLIIAN